MVSGGIWRRISSGRSLSRLTAGAVWLAGALATGSGLGGGGGLAARARSAGADFAAGREAAGATAGTGDGIAWRGVEAAAGCGLDASSATAGGFGLSAGFGAGVGAGAGVGSGADAGDAKGAGTTGLATTGCTAAMRTAAPGFCQIHQPAAAIPASARVTPVVNKTRRCVRPAVWKTGVSVWRACRPGTAPSSRSASARLRASRM